MTSGPTDTSVCRLLQKAQKPSVEWESIQFSFADVNTLIADWNRQITMICNMPARTYDPNWRTDSSKRNQVQLELPLT